MASAGLRKSSRPDSEHRSGLGDPGWVLQEMGYRYVGSPVVLYEKKFPIPKERVRCQTALNFMNLFGLCVLIFFSDQWSH